MTYLTSSFLLSDLRWLFSLLSHRFAIHFSSPPLCAHYYYAFASFRIVPFDLYVPAHPFRMDGGEKGHFRGMAKAQYNSTDAAAVRV